MNDGNERSQEQGADISGRIASLVADARFEHLSERDIDVAKKCILDTFGVILAASTLGEGCKPFVQLAKAGGGIEESSILGFGGKVPAPMAAFANGSLAHALDFEESHDGAYVHASACTVPAAFAVAESLGGVSGKDLILAVAIGNDLTARLGMALTENMIEYGWYMPPVLGSYGATASAGKLLGLTREQMLDAFSLNLCQSTCSAEITQNPQSVIRSVRDAFAAKSAVVSALLAKSGVSGFRQPFEGKRGFFQSFARGNYNPEPLTKELGRRFEGTGTSFKPWPSCRATHPYIENVFRLMKEHSLRPEEITSIHLEVSPVFRMLCEPLEGKLNPTTAIDAKFSIPFVVASAAVHGKVELANFTSEELRNPAVLAMARKVSYTVDEKRSLKEAICSRVDIHARGEIYSAEVDIPYGDPRKPLTDEQLLAKFYDCARYAAEPIARDRQEQLADLLLHLEQMEDIRDISRCLAP
jgi:2-methylcitrate dehydratase PrpD